MTTLPKSAGEAMYREFRVHNLPWDEMSDFGKNAYEAGAQAAIAFERENLRTLDATTTLYHDALARLEKTKTELEFARSTITKLIENESFARMVSCPGCGSVQRAVQGFDNSTSCSHPWHQSSVLFTRAELDARDKERNTLAAWKESAMSVTPPLQAIAKEIGVPLGASIHDKILPWILEAKRRLAAQENQSHAVPHKCPCCDGTGLTLRPPWVAGDAPGWDATTAAVHQCKVCSGAGILWSQPSTGRAE